MMGFKLGDIPLWQFLEYDLGILAAGEKKNFDLPFFNAKKMINIILTSSVAGMFYLEIFSRATRGKHDVCIPRIDSSETAQIIMEGIVYNDMDNQEQLHITITNDGTVSAEFRLVVKYE